MTEVFDILELVSFLFSGSQSGVVSHKRCEYTKCQPAQYQITCGICTETAQICTCVKETAHIQGWKHL